MKNTPATKATLLVEFNRTPPFDLVVVVMVLGFI